MGKKILLSSIFATAILSASSLALACGGANSGKHIGNVTAIDSKSRTFTIKDMESQKPITFKANDKIMASIKNTGAQVMVNYEEDDEGSLQAVGVTF